MGLLFIEKVPGDAAGFEARVNQMATNLNFNPNWIMGVMNSETGGTFRSDIYNQGGSGAVGLIQFMPATADELGTSTSDLAAMNNVEQLDWVEKYIKYWVNALKLTSINSYVDLYLMIFYPKAIGQPDNYVIGTKGDAVYAENAGIDMNGDGVIDVADFKQFVLKDIPSIYWITFIPQWQYLWPVLCGVAILLVVFIFYWFVIERKSLFDLPLLNKIKRK